MIEQQRFDVAFVTLQTIGEFGEADGEGVGSGALEEVGHFRIKFDAAELAHVIEDQGAVVEFEDGADVFGKGAIPEELAGHAEVHIKDPAIEVQENLFAAAADGGDGSAGEGFRGGGEGRAGDAMRQDFGVQNGVTGDIRRDGTNDGFYFREFGHGILGDVDEDGAVADVDGMAFELNSGVEIIDAGEAIEGPGVPGADDLGAIEIAVAQRAAGVGAEAVKAAESAVVIAEGVGVAVDFHLGEGAGWEVGEGFDFEKGHSEIG